MKPGTVARNYAEALFALAERTGRGAQYADLLDAVAAAVDLSPEVQGVLVSPRVPKAVKARLLTGALRGAPAEFVRFLDAVVRRGRQGYLREIATEYQALLDVKANRARLAVTLAREPDEALRRTITAALATALRKEVIATFGVDRDLLGGVVVRLGERSWDGSVRRRLARLRGHLVTG